MTTGRQTLFLDLAEVEERHNVVQRVCTARKHQGNPVLPLGDVGDWDSGQAGPWQSRSILYDEEERLFKAWYSGTDVDLKPGWSTGYAVSDDGIVWEKPKLGLLEYNGSTDNNLCMRGMGPVIKDEDEEDPRRRYKMIVKGPTAKHGIRAAYSADGIHWSEGALIDVDVWRAPDGSQSFDLTRPTDVVALIKDDGDPDPQRRYKMVWQAYATPNKPGPELVRTKCIGFGADIEHFTASPDNPILHPNDGLEQENHFLMLAPYASHWLLLYEYAWYMPDGTGKFGAYSGDIRLAASRDGEHYQRVLPHQKVIERGPRGAWDSGFLVISDKPVVRGDEIHLYYTGSGEEWTSWPTFGNRPDSAPMPSTGSLRPFRMGLATLRRDGFTCMETADRETPGHLTTCPIEVAQATELVVNVGEVEARRSWIEVEVLDPETGDALPGFDRTAAAKLVQDGTRRIAIWQDGELGQLRGRRVTLRFWLFGAARLYAFELC